MIVNTAIFTCSICGETSTDICAYCTKDTCANHLCQRCKRCSDCCECEVPLSPEEPTVVEEPAAADTLEHPAAETVSTVAEFLTPEEASVFAAEPEIEKSPISPQSGVFVETEHSTEAAAPIEDVPNSEPDDSERAAGSEGDHDQNKNGTEEPHAD